MGQVLHKVSQAVLLYGHSRHNQNDSDDAKPNPKPARSRKCDTPLRRRSVEERHFAAMRLLLPTPSAVTPSTGEPLALRPPMSSTNNTTVCYLCTT